MKKVDDSSCSTLWCPKRRKVSISGKIWAFNDLAGPLPWSWLKPTYYKISDKMIRPIVGQKSESSGSVNPCVLYFVNMKVVAGPDRNADKNNSSAKAECWYVFVAIREIFTWTRLESASCSGNTADSGAVTGMLSSTVRRAVKKNLYLTVVTITFINMSSLIYWNSGSHLGIY